MARQKFGLGATFQTASQSQLSVIEELEERNSSLEEEITRLKATSTTASEKADLEEKLQQLAHKLESQSGSMEVPLQEIVRNPFQPRTIFPHQEIEAFAKLLSEEGQNTPLSSCLCLRKRKLRCGN